MFSLLTQAMNGLYADQLPEGASIYKIAEYDPARHTAPNLWFEKRENPEAKYLAIIVTPTSSVPALGKTVSDAVEFALSKVAAREGRGHV
jgi:hypothetical protein